MENGTRGEFFLLGFSDLSQHQALLFITFFTMYITALVGNSAMVSVIWMDSQLHNPMYFFLGNLAIVDICFTSCTTPRLLVSILRDNISISLPGCVTQVFFLFFIGSMEFFLLALMAFDRYVAICNPLHYPMVMRKEVCLIMVCSSWIAACLNSLGHSVLASQLVFCGTKIIHHFFCDLLPLLKLSCSDTSINEMFLLTEGTLVVVGPFLFTLVSYLLIISSIMRIPSSEGKAKAFSTCSSHLIVVAIFYGTIISVYLRPASVSLLGDERVMSVVYSAVTPMLNPFIYTMRNRDVKNAFRRALKGRQASQHM